MRGGQFGFDDPAEKEIQTLFRNACPPGRGPSNQDQRDMDSVSDSGAGCILVSEARKAWI